jgi:hypothetical protein
MNIVYKDTFKYFSSLHLNIINGTVLDYGSDSRKIINQRTVIQVLKSGLV